MITSLLMTVKQPSLDDYYLCCTDKSIPFTLRAQIIQSYRRYARRLIFGRGPRIEPSARVLPARGRKKYMRPKRHVHGSVKNFFNITTQWLISVYKSAGKKRPSRKPQYYYATRPLVVHLKGPKERWKDVP